MRKVLFRYILMEQLPAIILGLFLFTFVLLSSQMLRSVNFMLGISVPMRLGMELLLCALPYLFLLTVPMACLLGVLMTYGRLTEQGEIVAMMAGGISYLRVISSALFLGAGISIGLYFWTDLMIPKSYQLRQQLAQRMIDSMTSIGITEGVFLNKFPGFVIYTKHYNREKSTIEGVTIYRMQQKSVRQIILAPKGKTVFDPVTHNLSIVLENASLYQISEKGELGWLVKMGSMKLDLDVEQIIRNSFSKGIKDFPGYSMSQLGKEYREWEKQNPQGRDEIKQLVKLKIEYHRRLALPLACLLVAFVAAPMGMLMGRGRRGILFLLSIGLITGYYFLLEGGNDMARQGMIPITLGAWMANGVLLLLGIGMNLWAARRF